MVPDYGERFSLVKRLGAGGMAEVWKAEMLDHDGFVALKRILPEYAADGDFRAMFMQEARICAQLEHANLVRVYDFGEIAGECYLAMEYLDGKNLHEVIITYLRRKLCPPPGLAAYVAHQLCRALAHAHALTDDAGRPLGLVHRDVSPSNVMLTFDGEVKLLDFGIAKLLANQDHRTQTGVLKGKSAYMAPERLASLPIDQRSDLFSAGVFLYEMLSGRRLFPGATPGTVVESQFAEAVDRPPSHYNREVPAELDAICRRALAREPEDRFSDGGAMASALDAVLRRLHWGAEQASAALCELFDRRDRAPLDVRDRAPRTEVPTVVPLPTTRVRQKPAGAWRWALPLAAVMLGATGMAWRIQARRSSSPTIEPAPAVLTPAAPQPVVIQLPEKPPVGVAAPPPPPAHPPPSPPHAEKPPASVTRLPAARHKPPHRTQPAPRSNMPHPLDDSELASPF